MYGQSVPRMHGWSSVVWIQLVRSGASFGAALAASNFFREEASTAQLLPSRTTIPHPAHLQLPGAAATDHPTRRAQNSRNHGSFYPHRDEVGHVPYAELLCTVRIANSNMQRGLCPAQVQRQKDIRQGRRALQRCLDRGGLLEAQEVPEIRECRHCAQ